MYTECLNGPNKPSLIDQYDINLFLLGFFAEYVEDNEALTRLVHLWLKACVYSPKNLSRCSKLSLFLVFAHYWNYDKAGESIQNWSSKERAQRERGHIEGFEVIQKSLISSPVGYGLIFFA